MPGAVKQGPAPGRVGRLSGYHPAMSTVPLSEAKDKLSALVEQAERTHETVTITRYGRSAAVLMGVDDLASLHETLFWLSQPGIHEDVATTRREVKAGRTTSPDALRAELGLPE
jgi:prevent-host-death family protein